MGEGISQANKKGTAVACCPQYRMHRGAPIVEVGCPFQAAIGPFKKAVDLVCLCIRYCRQRFKYTTFYAKRKEQIFICSLEIPLKNFRGNQISRNKRDKHPSIKAQLYYRRTPSPTSNSSCPSSSSRASARPRRATNPRPCRRRGESQLSPYNDL